MGAASRPLAPSYAPRSPEHTPLHRAVRGHLLSFLEEARARSAHGVGLPGFVEREFREYLGCGVLAHGFARVRCGSCGDEHLVGFSCKRRGVCPSCTTRRAVDAAAHLVDSVLPVAPMRQWVLSDEEPDVDALAELCAASMTARSSGSQDATPKRLTAFLEGFTLHAGVDLHAHDRRGLEQLCRYGARGAIALSRLSELDDGRYAYRMKRPLPDGRTHLVLDGVALLRKLAPLIPPPRFHLWRFHGVFAPNAKLRSRVVPKPPPTDEAATTTAAKAAKAVRPKASPYRLDWAAALKRVFGVDVLQCARCGGRLVILAFIEKRTTVRTILEHLGLPAVPLPLEKARGPPQAAWDF